MLKLWRRLGCGVWCRRWLVGSVGAAILLPLVLASSAAALPSNCSQSGSTVTCTYASTGAEQTFAVPIGVTGVHALAIGGTGEGTGEAGGAAAAAGGDIAVTPQETLYVEVGGNGTEAGAFGGGGASQQGFNGTGGGGAVLPTSVSVLSPASAQASAPRPIRDCWLPVAVAAPAATRQAPAARVARPDPPPSRATTGAEPDAQLEAAPEAARP